MMSGSAPPPPRSEDPQDAYDAAFRDIVAHFADPGRPASAPEGRKGADPARPATPREEPADVDAAPTGPARSDAAPEHGGLDHTPREPDAAPEDIRLDPTRNVDQSNVDQPNVDQSPGRASGTAAGATTGDRINPPPSGSAAAEPRKPRADLPGPASHGTDVPVGQVPSGRSDAPPPGWRVHIPPDDPDDEHYQPPPPTPLLSHDPTFWAAVIGCVGGPLWFLYLVLTDPYGSRMAMWAAGLLTAAGFAVTVIRLPRRGDTDPDDDGARV